MAARRYTLITFQDNTWGIHKPGCEHIAGDMRREGGTKRLVKVDLDADDEDLVEVLDPDGDSVITDYDFCVCTGPVEDFAPSPTLPQPVHAAAVASKAAATARLLREVEEAIDKLVAKRGVDDVGMAADPVWANERLETCTDDYVYDLAVEVRLLRGKGEPWWRVAYELELPGGGASNKQGRKGSAFARRLWRAAWGKTYLGERGQRESKMTREIRAMENEGRPYFDELTPDQEIVERITGQMLHWVARLNGRHGLITSAQETYVHDDVKLVKVKQGPQGRYVEFYEQVDPAQLRVDPRLSISRSGPVRAVYVDRITRVGV